MKKLSIGILALMLVALIALPVLATEAETEVEDSWIWCSEVWTYLDDRDDNSVDKDLFDDKDGIDFDVCYVDYSFLDFGYGGQVINGIMFLEKGYNRHSEIMGSAYSGAHGIVTTQLSSGNINLQLSNIAVDVKFMHDADLMAVGQLATGLLIHEKNYMRYDAIGGSAFSGAVGIITTQLSSGNGNLQQSFVDVEVSPFAFCHPTPPPVCGKGD